MKKKIIIIVSIIVVLVLAVGGAYLIDKNRMDNNKPVIFSTWGYEYAPPEVLGEIVKITDRTENEQLECVDAEELLYKDSENEYYFNCIKSHYIIVEYENGYKEDIKAALESGNATLADLKRFNISYFTGKKQLNEKQAVYDQSGDFLLVTLPEEWNYQIITDSNEQYQYSIKIYLDNLEKYAIVGSYKGVFGVCGTDLECEDIISNDGIAINVGYYGNDWSFMTFGYENKGIVAMNNGLKAEEAKKAIEILKTVKYDNTQEVKSFIGTVLESTTTYMVVEPSEDEYERKVADKIRINYGTDLEDYLLGMVDSKVVVTYSGDIKETYPAEINTRNVRHGYLDFEISVIESDKLEKKKILNNKELHKFNRDFDLYYYGIDEVKVKVDNKEMILEDALRKGYVTINDIISKANIDVKEIENAYAERETELRGGPMLFPIKTSYDDGGSVEYRYMNYTIIKYHTLDGNRDMYICKAGTSLNDLNK